MPIDFAKLAEPFPADDIEWRVQSSGMGPKGVWCKVLAYITARAIQKRLDEVCGPENWWNEEPRLIHLDDKTCAFVCGISVRADFGEEHVTKWDVAEPTHVEPAKGGFSSAMKRAGAQLGIGRYLYYLDETFADVSEEPRRERGWHFAKLSSQQGGASFHWKEPTLPGWALPKEPGYQVAAVELEQLKQVWRQKFAPNVQNPADLREGFSRFVASEVGEFPHGDHTCWTQDAWRKCMHRVRSTTEPGGVSSDVPFEEG